MSLNEYELVLITKPDLDEAQTTALVDKLEAIITEDGGHILFRDDWGQRKLAYAIGEARKGHYFIISNLALPTTIGEVERVMRITDGVLRFLFVRLGAAVDVDSRIEEAAEQSRIRAEEAARRAEAEAERQAAAAEYEAAKAGAAAPAAAASDAGDQNQEAQA